MANFSLWNEDCILSAKRIPDSSMDLVICDPPFGINEGQFSKDIYRREWDVGADCVMPGYVEAPKNYYEFTKSWLTEAKRILKPSGTIYIISGWTHLGKVLRAVEDLGLLELNHCIWRYNFGVYATTKFVSSHYHILRLGKVKKPLFYPNCRFGPQERDGNRSLQFNDLVDVFVVNKEYRPGEVKNKNKLPNALVEKLVLYSSVENDSICDFFMGNFTTAYVGLQLGRKVFGFELNKMIFDHHLPLLQQVEFGCGLRSLKKVEIIKPKNAGKPMSDEEKSQILIQFNELSAGGMTNKDAIKELCSRFSRGRFSIYNVIKESKIESSIQDAALET